MTASAAEKREISPPAPVAIAVVPGIVGFIDAVSANCVYGWAWDRSTPETRIEILVAANGRELGAVAASQLRDDLRAGGIGDGAHAFEFVIPDGIDPASVEVRARRPGSEDVVPLAPRGVPGAAASDTVTPVLEALLRSQRLLHRNLQSALLAQKEPPTPAGGDAAKDALASAQEALRQIEGVEVCLVRLDEQLHAMNGTMTAFKNRSGDRVTQILLGIVGAISAASLALSFVRFLG